MRLIDAMHQDGYSEHQARQADVWALRDGIYRAASQRTHTIKGIEPCRQHGRS
ncbi:MAG TPA: hypothetical protein VGC59_11195 [Solirubrobacteraceae bacterium]